jgi:hypothetical protein
MWSLMKAEICWVMVPRGSPGKVRLKFRPSTGEVRWPAMTAWTLLAGIRIRRPWTRPGSRSRIRSQIVIGPSYSSPWLPPSRITVGPEPFLITATGIRVTPQASSWGECGIMTKPACLPSRSGSTVRKALEGRGVAVLMVAGMWVSGVSFQIGAVQRRVSSKVAASAAAEAASSASPLSAVAAPASPMTPLSERVPSWRQR